MPLAAVALHNNLLLKQWLINVMVTITATSYLCTVVKKITTIVLAVIYLVSSFGISINRFYCCGELQSQNIGVALFNKATPKDNDCCKHTQTVIKVKDSHEQTAAGNSVLVSAVHLPITPFLPASYALSGIESTASNFSNGPPLRLKAIPLYIRLCTYRI